MKFPICKCGHHYAFHLIRHVAPTSCKKGCACTDFRPDDHLTDLMDAVIA